MNSQILVSDIQRFSLHDGPGIRTTVFLKGCTLRCPWCSNPETIRPQPQPLLRDGKQIICGRWMKDTDLILELMKDRTFFAQKMSGCNQETGWQISRADEIRLLPGGVTFSGGEPLAQIRQISPVIGKLHEEGIHIACESSLYIGEEEMTLALEQIDFFYADLKILDPDKAMQFQHGDTKRYLTNLERLLKYRRNGKRIPVVIRVPVIAGYTDGKEQRDSAVRLLTRLKEENAAPLQVELLKEHALGRGKYTSLGLPAPEYRGVEDETMEAYCRQIRSAGLEVRVCRI